VIFLSVYLLRVGGGSWSWDLNNSKFNRPSDERANDVV